MHPAYIHNLYWTAVVQITFERNNNLIQTNNKNTMYTWMHSNAFIIFHSSTNDWNNRFLIFLNGFYSLQQSIYFCTCTCTCTQCVFFSIKLQMFLGNRFVVHAQHQNKNKQKIDRGIAAIIQFNLSNVVHKKSHFFLIIQWEQLQQSTFVK